MRFKSERTVFSRLNLLLMSRSPYHARLLPILLAALTGLWPCSDAHAFKRNKHGTLSRAAFRLLHANGRLNQADERTHRVFARGSMAEDNPTMILAKCKNQHFHRTAWTPSRPAGHFVRRYARLERRMEGALHARRAKRAWKNAGRLAHYLQDMNCPPHVVPVYHTCKDAFDRYAIPEDVVLDIKLMDAWRSLDRYQLLDTISSRTVAALSEPFRLEIDEKPTESDWSLFWSRTPSEQEPAFGTYGPAGNRFGTSATFSCQPVKCRGSGHHGRTGNCCIPEPNRYRIEDATYRAFHGDRVRTAVAATATLIAYVDERLSAPTN